MSKETYKDLIQSKRDGLVHLLCYSECKASTESTVEEDCQGQCSQRQHTVTESHMCKATQRGLLRGLYRQRREQPAPAACAAAASWPQRGTEGAKPPPAPVKIDESATRGVARRWAGRRRRRDRDISLPSPRACLPPCPHRRQHPPFTRDASAPQPACIAGWSSPPLPFSPAPRPFRGGRSCNCDPAAGRQAANWAGCALHRTNGPDVDGTHAPSLPYRHAVSSDSSYKTKTRTKQKSRLRWALMCRLFDPEMARRFRKR